MRKQEVKTAVRILIIDMKSGTETGRELMFKHFQVYQTVGILEDLELLSQVLKETNAEFLVDFIALYSRSAAQQLDALLLE